MPLGAIAEGILGLLGRLLLEVVFEIVCYGMGLLSLKIATLGTYPPSPQSSGQEMICSLVGLAELAALLALAFWHFSA